MALNAIVLCFGLAVVVFGVVTWAIPLAKRVTSKDDAPQTTTIKLLGIEITTSAPAIAIAAIGLALVLVSTKLPEPEGSPAPSRARAFTLGVAPPGIQRDTANESIEIGIFYQGDELQTDAEKVATALTAAGYRYQRASVSLSNVIYSGDTKHHATVLIKSIAEYHDSRSKVRDLVLRALPNRRPEDVVTPPEDISYAGAPPARGVIQVDMF